MVAKILISPQYKEEKNKIREDIVRYSQTHDESPKPKLKLLRSDEQNLISRIKRGPLNAGEVFSYPVRKAISTSGNYATFYTINPPSAELNTDVKMVTLDSIIVTSSRVYNELVSGLTSADLEE